MPTTGCTPLAKAYLQNSSAPKRLWWSVSPMAGMPSSAARLTSSATGEAPIPSV